MRPRLDIDELLRKYEKRGSNPVRSQSRQSRVCSPKTSSSILALTKVKSSQHLESGKRTLNTLPFNLDNAREDMEYQTTRGKQGHFGMSKNECEMFLEGIRQQIKDNQQKINKSTNQNVQRIIQLFRSAHQELKDEVKANVEDIFDQNQRKICAQLEQYQSSIPSEYTETIQRMQIIQQEINRLIAGLKGTDFKKIIAEIVVKDFSDDLKKLQSQLRKASSQFQSNIQMVEISKKTALEGVQRSLKDLYQWQPAGQLNLSKDNTARKSLFLQNKRTSRRKNIFQNQDRESYYDAAL